MGNVQDSKSMETESRLVAVRGSVKGEMASNCQWVKGGFFWWSSGGTKNVLKIQLWLLHNLVNLLKKKKITELYISNMDCMVCELYLNKAVKKNRAS